MNDILSNKIVSIKTYNNDYLNKIDEVVDKLSNDIYNVLYQYKDAFEVNMIDYENELTSEGMYYIYFECSGNLEDLEKVWTTIKNDIESIVGYEKVSYQDVVSYYNYYEGDDTYYPNDLFSIDVAVPNQYFDEYIKDIPIFVD